MNVEQADYVAGPFGVDLADELAPAIERTFGATCEVTGMGDRCFVVIQWRQPRDDEWVGKFNAWVAGYMERARR